MAPMQLQARSNSVAQIAAGKAPVKVVAPKASGDIVGVDPLLVRLAAAGPGRCVYNAAAARKRRQSARARARGGSNCFQRPPCREQLARPRRARQPRSLRTRARCHAGSGSRQASRKRLPASAVVLTTNCPPQLGAAWRTVLGVRALSNPEKFVKGQFADAKVENAKANKARAPPRCAGIGLAARANLIPVFSRSPPHTQALALRCGLLNLQVAALQVAACNAGSACPAS
jgi:hypothetical protein